MLHNWFARKTSYIGRAYHQRKSHIGERSVDRNRSRGNTLQSKRLGPAEAAKRHCNQRHRRRIQLLTTTQHAHVPMMRNIVQRPKVVIQDAATAGAASHTRPRAHTRTQRTRPPHTLLDNHAHYTPPCAHATTLGVYCPRCTCLSLCRRRNRQHSEHTHNTHTLHAA